MGRQNAANIRSVPTGTMLWYMGRYDEVPAGFLLCNGAAVSRTTYAKLFAKISTLHGVGDGSTTFNLPNAVDRFVQGHATATTHAGATGGATSRGTSTDGGGGSNNAHDDPGTALTGEAHSHEFTDIRPKYLEAVPIIAF